VNNNWMHCLLKKILYLYLLVHSSLFHLCFGRSAKGNRNRWVYETKMGLDEKSSFIVNKIFILGKTNFFFWHSSSSLWLHTFNSILQQISHVLQAKMLKLSIIGTSTLVHYKIGSWKILFRRSLCNLVGTYCTSHLNDWRLGESNIVLKSCLYYLWNPSSIIRFTYYNLWKAILEIDVLLLTSIKLEFFLNIYDFSSRKSVQSFGLGD